MTQDDKAGGAPVSRPDPASREGGTSGSGSPEASARTTSEQDVAQANRESTGLAAGLTGEGGESRVAGTGSSVANSAKRTSEGTGGEPSPPDPGDPGGMGGARAPASAHDRPPGGVSPVQDD